jgi:hypothetical protein
MRKLKIFDIDENKKLGFQDVLSHDSSFVKLILYLPQIYGLRYI